MKKYILIIIGIVTLHNATAQWNTDRILNIGRNAYYYEDYVLSIQYFNQIIKIKPYLHEPYIYRAMAKISLGDYIGAEQDCISSIEINPFVPYAYYIRGFAKKNLSKYDEAIADFNKALEFDPDNSNYIANLIEAKERNKDFEGAIEDLKLFQKINPKAKGIDYEIGRIMLVSNDTIGAVKMMEKSIAKDSTMDMSYKLLAHIAELRGDVDEALNQLNILKRINPQSENLYVELAKLHIDKNDTTAASEALEQAIKYAPRNPYAYGAKAFLLMQQNKQDEAIKFYDKAIEYGSDFAGDYINRGVLNVKKYNFNQALDDYNYAILLDRNSSLAYYNRALLRNNLGDKNNALLDLIRVLELDPSNHEALLQQSNLLLELGYLDDAIRNFEAILEVYPYFAPGYYSLAEAYEKKGNKHISNNYKSMVFELVNNQDYYKKKQDLQATNKTVNITAPSIQESSMESLSDKLSAQASDKNSQTNYKNKMRGQIQKSFTELDFLDFAVCSFDKNDTIISNTNHYNQYIHNFNRENISYKEMQVLFSNQIIKADNIQSHFSHIDYLNEKIKTDGSLSKLYLARAIEFNLVQDFESAMDDVDTAIQLDANNQLAYFIRAYIQINMQEFEQKISLEESVDKESNKADVNRFNSMKIIKDLNKSIELAPDFSFAHYNKANYLANIKEYKMAIASYNDAIQIDPNFAEAYYGRALCHIFTNNEEAAKLDLSKSGELGIYKAYNLLSRLLKSK